MKRSNETGDKLCDVCEEELGSVAQAYCVDCDKYYCADCNQAFHQRGKFKHHTRESMNQAPKEPALEKSAVTAQPPESNGKKKKKKEGKHIKKIV